MQFNSSRVAKGNAAALGADSDAVRWFLGEADVMIGGGALAPAGGGRLHTIRGPRRCGRLMSRTCGRDLNSYWRGQRYSCAATEG